MLEQGKSVRSLPPEEGAADTTCNGLTSICATPSSTPVTPLCDWGGRNMQFQSKIKPKMREGWGEGGFKIWDNFFFSLPILIGNKLHFYISSSVLVSS